MELALAVEEYLTSLVAERGLAENTVTAYRRDLRQYGQFLANQSITSVESIDGTTVTAYMEMLR
ncbi:MAG: site-specific integrase, partial [Acidimicrobiia bacterium]|nr:site-specific integrase [Acidimicrobiia bacterium]MDX2466774.1 site-specific integrase [Acidimicrobiia bacterium]